MNRKRVYHRLLLLAVIVSLLIAAMPIVASDLFRQPYSPLWDTIHDSMARFQVTYNPTGGGAAPQWPYWRDPADAYRYYRDVSIVTEDGIPLAAWYVPAAEANAPSIILVHGLLDSKWTMLRIMPWLVEAGYNVMLVDLRGHGSSGKTPTTIGRKEILDIQACLDWLSEHQSGDRVGGLGMSLGAAALVNTAVQDERLDALVLDSLFADWGDTDYAQDYRLSPDWLVPDVPSPEALLPQVTAPVFVIHGTADILTHVEHAYRLFCAASNPTRLWINDSGHAWSAWTYPGAYQTRVLDFFDNSLQAQ